MPELGNNKKKKEAKKISVDENVVVSAYDEAGRQRYKADQRKTRIAAIIAVVILLGLMTLAIVLTRVL